MLEKVKNIVAKGDIAYYQQYLLLSQCFQKLSATYLSKCVCKWDRAKECLYQEIGSHTIEFKFYTHIITHMLLHTNTYVCPIYGQLFCFSCSSWIQMYIPSIWAMHLFLKMLMNTNIHTQNKGNEHVSHAVHEYKCTYPV